MRVSLLISSFVALTAAQSINFDLVSAAPSVSIQAAPVTGTAQSVSAQPTASINAVGSAAASASPAAQRRGEPVKRDGTCATQPAGTGPTIRPDTVNNFENNWAFTWAAYSAPIPKGYQLNFTNLKASTSTSSYMGYTNLNSYDTNKCASLCTAATGCVAFNIYFERDPTLDPNAQTCPNPPSLTNIKCVFWGVPISSTTATNAGQYRDSFQVVIAGSNGYNLAQPSAPSCPGFTSPISWPGAPNIPNDPTSGQNTYCGGSFFSFGLQLGQVQYFAPSVCTSACSARSAKNPNSPCNMVVAYQLTDPFGIARGMYCAMYTQSWDKSYGSVNTAQSVGGTWTVSNAFGYVASSYAASYQPISPSGYQGGNCGGKGAGNC